MGRGPFAQLQPGHDLSSNSSEQRADIGAPLAVALVVIAALCYSFHTTLSRATYDYGPGPMTILLFRSVTTSIALYIIIRLRGLSPWPKGKALWRGMFLGMLLAGQAAAMLSALYFIPASLLILIFYLFPMMVATFSHLTGAHRITAVNLVALSAAFIGVAIALGVAPKGLDWRGVVLGLIAALTVAGNIVGSGSVMRSMSPIVLTFVMAVAMMIVYVVANIVRGGVVLPRDPAGWWPLAGTVIAYLVASIALYSSIHRLGPPRVAMVMNVEPIFTITLASIILGERLTAIQFLGAAIVIAAIFANAYFGLRARRAQAVAEDR
jgi:drug/metabolite transporter (DMT)-like permease